MGKATAINAYAPGYKPRPPLPKVQGSATKAGWISPPRPPVAAAGYRPAGADTP